MKLTKIIKNINYTGSPDDREILYITHDSRKVKKGTLFIAISGENNDGHDYIMDALNKGAIAVVANGRSPITNLVPILQVKNTRKIMSKVAANFFGNPSKELNVIGITGTNGKTTTTQIIDNILRNCGKKSSSLGTLGFSSPTGLISTGFTTPESIELQHILRTLNDGGINYIPMEVSSHSIEMHRIDDINFHIAVFTNLSDEHLDFHGNINNYFNSKLKLFKKLNNKSIAIVNKDDKYYNQLIKYINCQYLSYGFDQNCDLSISSYKLDLKGTTADINFLGKKYKVITNLIGKYNLYNLMASILSCYSLGLDILEILKAIQSIKQIPGRLEKFNLINNNCAFIDYAHSEHAFNNVLSNIAKLKSNKKIITIFGCGGNRYKDKRAAMAEISEKFSYYTYITNDNPRDENPDNIIRDIIKGFKKNNFSIIKNRKKAIEKAVLENNNCIIMLLGKGIENYQLISGEKIPHSDIEIIKDFINENSN